ISTEAFPSETRALLVITVPGNPDLATQPVMVPVPPEVVDMFPDLSMPIGEKLTTVASEVPSELELGTMTPTIVATADDEPSPVDTASIATTELTSDEPDPEESADTAGTTSTEDEPSAVETASTVLASVTST